MDVAKVKVSYTPSRTPDKTHDWGISYWNRTQCKTVTEFADRSYSDWHRNNGMIGVEIIEEYSGQRAIEVWFKYLCEKHDLTFTYSDDGRVYQRGEAEWSEIKGVSDMLPREKAVQIWNSIVDSKLKEPYNRQFHWKK